MCTTWDVNWEVMGSQNLPGIHPLSSICWSISARSLLYPWSMERFWSSGHMPTRWGKLTNQGFIEGWTGKMGGWGTWRKTITRRTIIRYNSPTREVSDSPFNANPSMGPAYLWMSSWMPCGGYFIQPSINPPPPCYAMDAATYSLWIMKNITRRGDL